VSHYFATLGLVPTKLAPGIREKRPGYFEIRVYGGVDPATGKTRQVSRTLRGTVKEANELRASLLLEVTRKGVPGSQTLSELFDAVLEHLEALGREETTLHGYRRMAVRILEVLGDKPLRKLRASDLDRFYAGLTKGGASAGRVRRYHAFIHRSLAQAVRWEWVPDNVSDRASPPSEPRRQMELQSVEAVNRLIEVAAQSKEPELALAFRILAAMGGRRGELCGLQWRDVDFGTGVCHVRRAVKQISGRPLIIGDAKDHQQRSVQLDPVTLEILAAHRGAMAERAEICGTKLAADAFVLSDAADGSEPWKPGRLTQALTRLRKRAGYTGRLHDLRHWHASLLLNAGEAPVVVAERLGHRDPSTTHRFYAHALPRADIRAAGIVADALSSTTDETPPD
jgi:integrase